MDVNGVQFDEQPTTPRPASLQDTAPKETFANWLIRHKIAKSPIAANNMLLLIIGVCIVGGVTLLLFTDRPPVGPTPEQVERFNRMT